MEPSQRYNTLKRVSIVTLIINLALASAELIIGAAFDSVSVISDGVNNAADVFTTIALLIGIHFSGDAADDQHPYGHQKIESVMSLFLAVALGVTAVFIGIEGVKKLLSGGSAEPSILAVIITAASLVSKEGMFRYTKSYAKKLDSLVLMTEAWHHRSDAVSALAVLIGVVGNMAGLWYLEPVAAIIVALIILKAAFDILRDAFSQVVDKRADDETQREIMRIVLSIDGVEAVDEMRTRISGNIIFVDLDIAVKAELPVHEAHDIAENVHDAIENAPLKVGHCMVHINPA